MRPGPRGTAGNGVTLRGVFVGLGGIAVLLVLFHAVPVRPFGVDDLLWQLSYVPILGAAIAFAPGGAGKRVLARKAAVFASAGVFVLAIGGAASADSGPQVAATTAATDTTGAAVVQWAYDSWTVPWVQTRGEPGIMTPSAHATLIALGCATAELERDRLARHLDPQECEHRMAEIRADQDTALVFSVALEVVDSPISASLVRLLPEVTLRLEDERGKSWAPVSVERGAVLGALTGIKLRRLYEPPWIGFSGRYSHHGYGVTGGRNVSLGQHRVRFARRDAQTGEPVLTRGTRWLQLRLSYGGSEWVATWPFRPEETHRP